MALSCFIGPIFSGREGCSIWMRPTSNAPPVARCARSGLATLNIKHVLALFRSGDVMRAPELESQHRYMACWQRPCSNSWTAAKVCLQSASAR